MNQLLARTSCLTREAAPPMHEVTCLSDRDRSYERHPFLRAPPGLAAGLLTNEECVVELDLSAHALSAFLSADDTAYRLLKQADHGIAHAHLNPPQQARRVASEIRTAPELSRSAAHGCRHHSETGRTHGAGLRRPILAGEHGARCSNAFVALCDESSRLVGLSYRN
jgi:hypothetical protein